MTALYTADEDLLRRAELPGNGATVHKIRAAVQTYLFRVYLYNKGQKTLADVRALEKKINLLLLAEEFQWTI